MAECAGCDSNVSLPVYLDVHEALKVPHKLVADSQKSECALFQDDGGRIIAQCVGLVKESKKFEVNTDKGRRCEVEDEEKKPEVILVVSTDTDDTGGSLANLIEGNSSDGIAHATANSANFLVSGLNNPTNYGIMDNQVHCTVDHNYDLEYFPCVRKQWYIVRPVKLGVLVDDCAVIDTIVLAKDVRQFLKSNSISLETFAKQYMHRSQGTLSDLLNHPKDWSDLSRKGKNTYIKFMEFLSDSKLTTNVVELRTKHTFVSPGIPTSLLQKLSNGVLPVDQEISNAAVALQLKVETLMKYCKQQVALWENSDVNHVGEHISDTLGRYICGEQGCGAILQGRDALEFHISKNLNTHSLRVCDQQGFMTKASIDSYLLNYHELSMMCTHHGSPATTSKNGLSTDDVGDEKNLPSYKFICGMCWTGFKSRQRLTKHLSVKHSVNQKHLRPGLTCFICLKVVRNVFALEVHMRAHTNSRPFECNQCKVGFQTKANLQRHMKTHTGERPYCCKYCSARFIEEKALIIHTRTHTGEKPLKCKICSRRFAHKAPLNLHMLIHEGKKPHLCETCGKRFRQKVNLQVHMKRHIGSKKHKCPDCDLSFLTKTDFGRHHMTHTGEKPYQCSVCSKPFTRNVYLQEHLKKLESPTVPECEVCRKKLCNDSALKRHRKIHALMPQQENSTTVSKDIRNMQTDEFTITSTSNSNIILLGSKPGINNEKQYLVAPVQHLEKGSEDLGDRMSLQSVVLSQNNDYDLPLNEISGQSFFVQCVDLSGNPVPLLGPAAEISDNNFLSSMREITIPIAFSSDTRNKQQSLEISDPNMQSTIPKALHDSVILTEDVPTSSSRKCVELDISSDQCSMVMSESNSTNETMVIAVANHSQAGICNEAKVTCESDEDDIVLTEAQVSELCGITSQSLESKTQTFIIVDTEL